MAMARAQKERLFSPIKPKRAFEKICDEIKRLIFTGTLKPGDRLPTELELTSQFNVSRQTVREALRLLETTGFINMQKGGTGGPLIVDTILNTISNSFLDAFQLRKISIDELTAARIEIERMVLKAVLARDDQDYIEALEENVRLAKELLASRKEPFRELMEFHMLLARASKNYIFAIMVESLLTITADIRSRLSSGAELDREAVLGHEKILQAIKRRDREKVLAVMEKHLTENAVLKKAAVRAGATRRSRTNKQ
jgi:GntR family transcriptional regulator, transcriptional repressor for pyruvate dehydrogenase complex